MSKKYVILGVALVLVSTVAVWVTLKLGHQKPHLTFVFQSARGGVLETCGCHSYPYGGIDREANFLNEVRASNPDTFYVDSGNLFVAPAKDRTGTKDRAQLKAKVLLEMLNEMKLDVFSPGSGDYYLGLSDMKALEKQSHFKWISSNVVDSKGELVFAPYAKIQRNGVTVAFLAITPEGPIEDAPELKALSPKASIEKYLAEAKQGSDIVVLLSQQGVVADEELLSKKDLGISIAFGADQGRAIRDPYWFNGHTIMVDPEYYGYTAGRLDLDLALPLRGLYSKEQIKKNRDTLAQLEKDAQKFPDDQTIKKRIEIFKKSANFEPIPGGTEFTHQLVRLDKEHYGKPNSITQRITSYKEEIKQKALAE